MNCLIDNEICQDWGSSSSAALCDRHYARANRLGVHRRLTNKVLQDLQNWIPAKGNRPLGRDVEALRPIYGMDGRLIVEKGQTGRTVRDNGVFIEIDWNST